MSEQPTPLDTGDEIAGPPVPRPSPWRQLLLGALILVCGIAIGAGGSTLLSGSGSRNRLMIAVRQRERTPALMAERMRRELGLSAEQAEKVEEIVRKRLEAVWQIRDEQRPRIDEQLQGMRKDIAEVLTPEQARQWSAQFEKLLRPSPGSPRHPGHPEGRGGWGGPPGHIGNGWNGGGMPKAPGF